MTREAFVVGVGMTPFTKPGSTGDEYFDMARVAGQRALDDAGLPYQAIEQAAVGYVYGESTSGQRAVYELGLTGLPIYNVNNNCSTGSTALFLATQLVSGGLADVVLALGFERMGRGSLGAVWDDRPHPAGRHYDRMGSLWGWEKAPAAAQLFGNAAREHMKRYGTTAEQLALIGVKNHRHSVNNPYAQFRDAYTLEEVMAARTIHGPLTKLQCCPTSDGAAAAIVASRDAIERYDLGSTAVHVAAIAMTTDTSTSFEGDMISLVGADMTRAAAKKVFADAAVGPDDVDVIELHDCFSANELLTYEALGLCGEGEGGPLAATGDTTYGGRWVINPSGGLISKGHPLGATGLAQCAELCWQVRGEAAERQVAGAKRALQHNLGLGGAAVVALYERG